MFPVYTPQHVISSQIGRSRRRARAFFSGGVDLLTFIAFLSVSTAVDCAEIDPVKPFQDQIYEVREHFRIVGLQGATINAHLAPIESGLQALADRSTGGLRARALLELGRTQRMGTSYAAAIANLTEAAKLATAVMLPDVAIDAWLNIARAYVVGPQRTPSTAPRRSRANIPAGNSNWISRICVRSFTKRAASRKQL